MSNQENIKKDPLANIKGIEKFVGKVISVMDDIKSLKGDLAETTEVLVQKRADFKSALQETVEVKVEKVETVEVKEAPVVAEAKAEAVVAPKEVLPEKPLEKPAEAYQVVKQNPNNYQNRDNTNKNSNEGQPKYNNVQGNRPYNNNGTGTATYANRPSGTGTGTATYANRPSGTGTGTATYANRPNGSSTYQGNRPYNNNNGTGTATYGNRPYNNNNGTGTGTATYGNRPYNNNGGGYQGNRPFNNGGSAPVGRYQNNNRPSLPRNKMDLPLAADVLAKDNNKKKKIISTPVKDEKKTLNKKTLLTKGYVSTGNFMEDSEFVKYHKQKKAKKDSADNAIVIDHAILTSERITVKILSEKIGKTATEIIKKLFDLGITKTINEVIDFATADLIASEFDITLELKVDKTAEEKMEEAISNDFSEQNRTKRPPVVTIMGHVDHGKTSLLDYIRKASVASGEAGGITQHIGAYTITLNGESITFLDTPGHEAFTAMRKRGAKVTDIAVIVVAADDGIMPQTIEAINHAKSSGVSIIVAVNKIDKADANLERIKQQLTQYELVPEEWGGDTIVCPVSAKTGAGVKNLLENILLVAEIKDLRADATAMAQGSIIEAKVDKGTGPVATVLIQNGTLRIKDFVVAGVVTGRVRAMIDDKGQRVKEATPSMAVSILGFTDVPQAGDILNAVKEERLAKQIADDRMVKIEATRLGGTSKMSLEDMFKNIADGEKKVLNCIVKGDVQGSVEALKQGIEKLSIKMEPEGVKINIIHCDVGAVNESDVMLADTSDAIIISFNVRPNPKAKQLAEKSQVDIKYYRIIYDMLEDLEKALKGMLDPIYEEEILGHIVVRTVFNISDVGTIAGSYVTDGKVQRNAKVRLLRDNIVIYEGSICSLRRMKDDVKDVNAGYECGVGLEKYNDIKVEDVIEVFVMKEKVRG
ncbi:MAG: translation initiation factor IF-2 [Clostridia bacterium]